MRGGFAVSASLFFDQTDNVVLGVQPLFCGERIKGREELWGNLQS